MARRRIVLDCGCLHAVNARHIELLACLAVVARQIDGELYLVNASDALAELIDLCGLGSVLRIEPRRQAEQREQPCGIEEERQLDDPTI